jgi:hypothetical protein
MNINRLNYENYFLLYVDGELSAAEMQTVDRFAAENKDLADELKMLLHTRLPEETYYFENKSALLRTASDHINSINCEEKFLLFIDNELTDQGKVETMHFVSTHPEYLGLFETLKQSKLPIEQIDFPDKESLFRKEESSKPVIVLQWWKLAVAAALIGIIAILGIFITDNTTNTTVAKSTNNAAPNILKQIATEHPELIPNKIENKHQFAQTTRVVSNKSNTPVIEKNTLKQPIVAESLVANTEITKHIDAQETIALKTINTTSSNNLHSLTSETNEHASLLIPINNQSEETAAINYAKPAVYKELDTDDERKSLYVGSVEINKDKLRGFLRKASSLFKGRNKTEEEKTEIANIHTLE